MKQLGYVIDLNPYHKYATIRSVNSKKATRLYRLGETYDRDAIYDKMRDTLQNNWQEAYRLYNEFTAKKNFDVTIQKAYFVKGNLKTAKKITGLTALYFRYLYLLGVLPKNKKHKPLSPEMREACRSHRTGTAHLRQSLNRYFLCGSIYKKHRLRNKTHIGLPQNALPRY